MNAIPSAIPESKIAEQRAHEPSMEEILASIRKIISDDQALPLTPRFEPVEIEESAPALMDAEPMEAEAPETALSTVEDLAEPDFPPMVEPDFDDEPEPAPAPIPVRQFETERLRPPMPPRSLFDVSRDGPMRIASPPPPRPARPSAEIRELAPRPLSPPPRLVSEPVDAPAPLISDKTNSSIAAAFKALGAARAMPGPEAMEQAARELMRPMLKQWLDDNLPNMVEGLVRAEIERITRGR